MVLLLVRTIPRQSYPPIEYHSLLGIDMIPDWHMDYGAWELLDGSEVLEKCTVIVDH